MDILNKALLTNAEFLFTSDPEQLFTELFPTFSVTLFQFPGPADDLWRLQEFLNQEENIICDFNKSIKQALDFFLKKVISEADLQKIEEIKVSESKKILELIKVNKPQYSWIKKIRKDK